uniref:Uncharacterized protein n=1 Tax=Glossina palpalis gambiensis TaxID=67801 RepID=A0A1B0BBG7_9MUSC
MNELVSVVARATNLQSMIFDVKLLIGRKFDDPAVLTDERHESLEVIVEALFLRVTSASSFGTIIYSIASMVHFNYASVKTRANRPPHKAFFEGIISNNSNSILH